MTVGSPGYFVPITARKHTEAAKEKLEVIRDNLIEDGRDTKLLDYSIRELGRYLKGWPKSDQGRKW